MSIYDSYDLFEIIGHGTTCTVKRAVRKENQQVFAAKLYQADILTAKNQIEMLIRLDHPNIVNIYQIFEDQNQYMQGGQLYDYLGQKKTMTQSHVMQFIKTLFDAIRYCHQINVVHRDIKPQNLLLTSRSPEGILKLADFGISKILSDDLLTTNCGTPVYMAPEIWRGQPYDSKVDVWSIGVVMYYLLSGFHPFYGDSQTIGQKIVFDQLKFEEKAWNSISSKAIDLIKSLLQKDPMKRPSALESTTHIWFTSHITIPSPITQDEQGSQVSLYRNVHKIRRYNFKRKLKKSKKKIKSLTEQSEKMRYPHLQFLVTGKNQQSTMQTQLIESQLNILKSGFSNLMDPETFQQFAPI